MKKIEAPLMPVISCRGCGIPVEQPVRSQGGGCAKEYCSTRCRSRMWARDNKERSDEIKRASRRRRPRQDDPDRRKAWQRASLLRRYGLTPISFDAMLERQRGRCLGCLRAFTDSLVPHIDHDHLTDTVRGLLCSNCNTTLGFVREDRETLARLSAYLELDRSQSLIYVVGSLRNPQVTQVASVLRAGGYDVFDDYMSVGPEADDYWRDYEKKRGHSFAKALNGRAATHTFHFDKSYLDLADALVMVLPAGRSCHLELGYLAGMQKPCIMFGKEEPDRFDVMVQFASTKVHHAEDLVRSLDALLGTSKQEVPHGS